ncbi:hypothetical protein LTR36_009936 [Oleoguttula mirabilis]|uniref:Uncharacterized protein n=1 Tax=Oleoguttula mirabilis TaxID=1507867 RepID=A0AAV9J5P1_9PEZI|nr:hypothetical protein LTR36_009936 [Oleoguttula mirabilis]
MGSGQSKQAKDDGNSTKGGKRSPNQEKHASADSTTPLAANAAQLAFPQTPNVDKHASFGEKSLGRSRTNTMSGKSRHTQLDVVCPQADSIGLADDTEDSITTAPPLKVHELEGHSNVSRPPPPPRIRHLSELIDPADLAVDGHVRSPSGNLLAPAQFLVHPDRPRSIRERQEDIREKVRVASRLGVQSETAEQLPKENEKATEKGKSKAKTKRAWCSCFRS